MPHDPAGYTETLGFAGRHPGEDECGHEGRKVGWSCDGQALAIDNHVILPMGAYGYL
jgi:hypothetical protein